MLIIDICKPPWDSLWAEKQDKKTPLNKTNNMRDVFLGMSRNPKGF